MQTSDLKEQALILGIKQSQVAESIGCSQGQVSKVFSGQIPSNSKIYCQVSRYLDRQLNDPTIEGRAILSRLIEECWNGTTEHALAINDLVRAGLKLSQSGEP
jgi:predicted transcriptional regulator